MEDPPLVRPTAKTPPLPNRATSYQKSDWEHTGTRKFEFTGGETASFIHNKDTLHVKN